MMHRRMIEAAMIVGLTSGLMGAAAYAQFVRPAFADTGPLSGLNTREQNLDANGLIRVHEQGTPTVSVGNFPATQPVSGTVNVGNLPATQNVNIVGGGVTAGIPVVSKARDVVMHVNTTSLQDLGLSINATHISTDRSCSRYRFFGVIGGFETDFTMSPGQSLDFTYAIPLNGVAIYNDDPVFACDGHAAVFGT